MHPEVQRPDPCWPEVLRPYATGQDHPQARYAGGATEIRSRGDDLEGVGHGDGVG